MIGQNGSRPNGSWTTLWWRMQRRVRADVRLERAEEMVGASMSAHVRTREEKTALMIDLIRAGYRVTDFEVLDVDRHGKKLWTSNTIIGVVEDRQLIYAWACSAISRPRGSTSGHAAKRVRDPPAREATCGRGRPAEAVCGECPPQHRRRRVHHRRATPDHVVNPGPRPSPASRQSTSSAGPARRCCTRIGATADRCATAPVVQWIAPAPAGNPCRRLRSRMPTWRTEGGHVAVRGATSGRPG